MINCESKQLFNIQVWGSEDDKQKDGLSLAIFAKLLSNWLIQLCWWDCKTDGRNRWAKCLPSQVHKLQDKNTTFILNCFEVSTKGFLNTRNHSTLTTLHKFVKPNITKSQFKSNISALSLTASYHIFLCKDEPTFLEPPYLLPPLVTKKAIAST